MVTLVTRAGPLLWGGCSGCPFWRRGSALVFPFPKPQGPLPFPGLGWGCIRVVFFLGG
jgi:hypothetical protein